MDPLCHRNVESLELVESGDRCRVHRAFGRKFLEAFHGSDIVVLSFICQHSPRIDQNERTAQSHQEKGYTPFLPLEQSCALAMVTTTVIMVAGWCTMSMSVFSVIHRRAGVDSVHNSRKQCTEN